MEGGASIAISSCFKIAAIMRLNFVLKANWSNDCTARLRHLDRVAVSFC
jgi:hypothetical protein